MVFAGVGGAGVAAAAVVVASSVVVLTVSIAWSCLYHAAEVFDGRCCWQEVWMFLVPAGAQRLGHAFLATVVVILGIVTIC